MLVCQSIALVCSLIAPLSPAPRAGVVGMKLPDGVRVAYEGRFSAIGSLPASLGSRNPRAEPVKEADIEALWKALVRAFDGDTDLALAAVGANPSVVHPLYTKRPVLITASQKALVDILGSREAAREVMLRNPAVLQCGDSLRSQPADQIRMFASFRAGVDRVPPNVSRGVLLVGFASLLSNFVLVRSDEPGAQRLAEVIKPVLGAAGATLFLSAAGFAAMAEAGASTAKRSGYFRDDA